MKKQKITFLLLILFSSIQMGYAQNYEESKVGDYRLPKLLVTQNGQTISTPEQWENNRRPEILKLFENHVFGQVPKDFEDIRFKVTNQDKKAMDEKATLKEVAITISNESGNSGAALSRRNFGETVERITNNFPYWFCPNYRQYAGNEDKLPVDQHMLLALIAPRPVYVASAAEDLWADPKGQYLGLYESQPAFNLYGIETNLPEEMPSVNEQIIRPHMGFHNREGKHNMTPYDWQQFINFANVYLNRQ